MRKGSIEAGLVTAQNHIVTGYRLEIVCAKGIRPSIVEGDTQVREQINRLSLRVSVSLLDNSAVAGCVDLLPPAITAIQRNTVKQVLEHR